jgi:hypothetical protein
MDSNIIFQLTEAYRYGVYNEETLAEEELVNINEWVSFLISEGYDLDQYTDEELCEAYLSDLDEAKKTVMSVTSSSGKKRALNTTRATSPASSLSDPNYEFRDIASRKKGQEGISFTPSAERKARTRGQEQISRDRQGEKNRRSKFITRRLQTKFGIPDSALDPHERSKGLPYRAADIRESHELDLYDVVSEYLVSEGFCDSYEDADVIMANMSEEWRESIMEEVLDEARQPISRASREQISNIVGTTDAPYASFKNPEKQKTRVRKLITGLEKSDKSRQKGELPVGRMARKVHTLLSRPRRSGADKEADYARAEYIDNIMRNR